MIFNSNYIKLNNKNIFISLGARFFSRKSCKNPQIDEKNISNKKSKKGNNKILQMIKTLQNTPNNTTGNIFEIDLSRLIKLDKNKKNNLKNKGSKRAIKNDKIINISLKDAAIEENNKSLPSVITGIPKFPNLLALPLYRKPAFPGFYQILQVQDSKILETIISLNTLTGSDYVGAFLTKEPYNDESINHVATLRHDAGFVENIDSLNQVGTVVHLISFSPHVHSKGGQLIVMPHNRIRITGLAENQIPNCSLFNVNIEYIKDETVRFDDNITYKALHLEIIATMKELLKTSYFYKEHFDQVVRFYNLDYPHKLADLLAGMSFAKREELQAVLNEENIEKRLHLVLEIAKSDLEFSKLQGFQNILEEKKEFICEDVIKIIEQEINKLSFLEPISSEFNISRTYLEWLIALPYGTYTSDNSDLKRAEQILNEDHYGLKSVKDRIIEFIAVNILSKGHVQGKILCLVGPPGVGKTSIVSSIARALDRKFFRLSLGGLFDVAEIRGHRRTYVGAMPGKIVQALKYCKSFNPVVLLDEVDKIGRDNRGDPASALLEVLDPNQNSNFRDHYLDIPIDLSKILFVCTANSEETIPGPLLDRIEIIRLSGYVFEEKIQILKNYIIPSTIQKSNLKEFNIELDDTILEKITQQYSREAGVRTLLKNIERIFRKIAVKVVRDKIENYIINDQNIIELLGQPQFTSDKLFSKTPPGVVMGLAWSQMGGATLYIEVTGAIRNSEKPDSSTSGSFQVTGQLGSVMNESCQIAFTHAKIFMSKIDHNNKFLDLANIHVHVPEGSTPKDGPSAGVTITTAILSLAKNKSIIDNIAMTGELTLTGKVLKIGGVKEKVIAAKRENIKKIIFPAYNKPDFEELEDYIKNGMEIFYVENYEEIYKLVFNEPGLP